MRAWWRSLVAASPYWPGRLGGDRLNPVADPWSSLTPNVRLWTWGLPAFAWVLRTEPVPDQRLRGGDDVLEGSSLRIPPFRDPLECADDQHPRGMEGSVRAGGYRLVVRP